MITSEGLAISLIFVMFVVSFFSEDYVAYWLGMMNGCSVSLYAMSYKHCGVLTAILLFVATAVICNVLGYIGSRIQK